MPVFHEQPPLYFGMLSLFYKIFGESMYVERFFSLLMLIVTGFYIRKIWTLIFRDQPAISGKSWLPVILWITVPVCFWSYNNLVEEIVMSISTTSSVYYILKAILISPKPFFDVLIAGLLIFLASLTKGFQGLFPIGAPVLYWIANRKNFPIKKCLNYSLMLGGIPAIIYALLLLNPVVYSSFDLYFKARLIAAFTPGMGAETTGNHFDLIFRLFSELIPCLGFMVIVLIITRIKNIFHLEITSCQNARWFLLLGLSASLPLMVTLEQREFYLTTSLPFFAMAISLFIAPSLSTLLERVDFSGGVFRIFKFIAWALLVSGIIYSGLQIGKFSRDENLLRDIYTIENRIPSGETVSIPVESHPDWSIRMYFNRTNDVNLKDIGDTLLTYCVFKKSDSQNPRLKAYKLVSLNTKELDLYKLKE